jgi:hypothetical protein
MPSCIETLLVGRKIKTKYTTFLSLQKNQKSNFEKFQPGISGTIKGCCIDSEYNIPYFVCKFMIPNPNYNPNKEDSKEFLNYWAKLNGNCIEFI